MRSLFPFALLATFLSAAVAQPVIVVDNGSTVTLDNGILTATISKNQAIITSMRYAGFETVMPNGNIYYSMDGGSTYEIPSGCVYRLAAQTPDLVDISLTSYYTGAQPHAFDKEIHYVMRSGDSGVYTYAVLTHPASYPATAVSEWRQVWKLPHDSVNFTFEKLYVDALRNWLMPSYYDYTQASPTGIAEITQLNTGPWAGQFEGKYEYNANYWDLNTWGHASDVNGIGAWAVFGNHEWFNDGPTKQDLTSASGIIHVHFGMEHYGGSGTNVAAGESWSKVYGPYLLYVNSCPNGADDCWADAQARAQAEQAAWPYSWLSDNRYPLSGGRGSVTGTFQVSDALKPVLTGAGAWIGLAQPDPGGNWQFESKQYQYWVQAGADGRFTIPNVRPGSYTLYAFVSGAIGEFSQDGVNVDAGAVTSAGALNWNVPHPGTSIAWEIGVPDRSAAEFRHGSDYFVPYRWLQFSSEFTNPLEYTVGVSDWSTDWNYVQSAYVANGTNYPWTWRIHFNLDSVPDTGNATLTLAWASANSAAIQVFVNDDTTVFKDFYPNASAGGNALIRQGIHAKYGIDQIAIPVSLLQPGANTVALVERRVSDVSDHVMYDYLSLELP